MSSNTGEPEARRLQSENDRLRAENAQLVDDQRAALDARDYFLDVFENFPVPSVALDALGTIRSANQCAFDLLRPARQGKELVGSRLKHYLSPTDHPAWAEHLRNCEHVAGAVSCEVQLQDGSPVRVSSRRVRPGLRLYPTLIIDLREQIAATEEMRRLFEAEKQAREASEAKDDFIATLSHELRTPLTPVMVAVTALNRRPGLPDDLRATCEMIRRNVAIEARLIDDLLDVTRIARRKMRIETKAVDLHAAVREVCETLMPQFADKHIEVRLSLEAASGTVSGDAVRLKQVFWNLLQNAVKFTPPHGRVDVRSWDNMEGAGGWLNVEVRDSGQGFAPDLAGLLFHAFEQGPDVPERNGGLGLGLAICKGVMELHNGRIVASSQGPSLGARFVVSMPSSSAEVEKTPGIELRRPAGTAADGSGGMGRRRILLVEDDVDTADTLGQLLEEHGFVIITARSAGAALQIDFDDVDVLISDIGLPDLSGLELMRRIRSRSRRVPTSLALSGYGTEADISASVEAGFMAHLTKPVDFDSLLAAIENLPRA